MESTLLDKPLSANVLAAPMGQPHILQCKTNAPWRSVKTA